MLCYISEKTNTRLDILYKKYQVNIKEDNKDTNILKDKL